jgi:hypothetical protein
MFRTTQDVLELRRWAELHGARPCREPVSGRLVLSLPHAPCGEEVGWEEFEPTFVTCRFVFVYEDAPGALRNFLGPLEEAHAFVVGGPQDAAPAP